MALRIPRLAGIGVSLLIGLAASTGLATGTPASGPAATSQRAALGADVSWPNCPKGEGIPSRRSKGEPMPKRSARFVVLGVTNGPGFNPNSCLARELDWVLRHHRMLGAYALTTRPDATQIRRHGATGPFDATHRGAQLRNSGYAEATYNVRTMARVGLSAPLIWVDVEPYPVAPWSHRHAANRAVITGVIRGYRDNGYRVGIYTYAKGWREIVGRWRLPSLPAWSTAGRGRARQARAMCTRGPSGGATWLAQWWRTPRRDFDLICPETPHPDTSIFSRPAGS